MIHWLIVLTLACSEPEPLVIPVVEKPAPLPELFIPLEERYAATHILIAYDGAARAPAHVSRSPDTARELAQSLHQQAVEGAVLEDLARANSDGGSAKRGGSLGVYRTGTMMPNFEAAVASVEVGKVAPLTESPFGFHIARRDMVIEYHAQHIIITWGTAHNSKSTRTKEQATLMIQGAAQRLKQGIAFEDVAREISEDSTAQNGGDLGIIAPGQFVPDFETALKNLAPGQVSDVVETPYGLHLIKRIE
jgi:peptidyl-prolyl cis-trans isomerase SurA